MYKEMVKFLDVNVESVLKPSMNISSQCILCIGGRLR